MADFTNPQDLKDVNVLITTYDRNATSDGRLAYLDVQIDHRDPRFVGQHDPHLVSTPLRSANRPDAMLNHGRGYTTGSLAAMKDAAGHSQGPGNAPILNGDGQQVGVVLAVKATLAPSGSGGYVIDVREPMVASDYSVDQLTLTQQQQATQAQRQSQARGLAPDHGGPTPPSSSQAGLASVRAGVRSVASTPGPGQPGSRFNPLVVRREAVAESEGDPLVIHSADVPGRGHKKLRALTATEVSALGRIGQVAADGAKKGAHIGRAISKVGPVFGGTDGAAIGAGSGVVNEVDRVDAAARPSSRGDAKAVATSVSRPSHAGQQSPVPPDTSTAQVVDAFKAVGSRFGAGLDRTPQSSRATHLMPAVPAAQFEEPDTPDNDGPDFY